MKNKIILTFIWLLLSSLFFLGLPYLKTLEVETKLAYATSKCSLPAVAKLKIVNISVLRHMIKYGHKLTLENGETYKSSTRVTINDQITVVQDKGGNIYLYCDGIHKETLVIWH